tara:strand:+ start:3299 stop:4114 length:816 start_codon:yes stop_codon:yes gene_type:complete
MKVGIVGYGVVGKAATLTFEEHFDIVKYDKFQNLDNFVDLRSCDFVFIMVPTPFDCIKNKVDDSAVTESLSKLEEINYTNTVVIKSTLPPGTCDNYSSNFALKIIFNPEFLRESTTPNEDFKNQDKIVIGTNQERLFSQLKSLYSVCAVSHAQYYHTTLLEAEMIKSAQNTMLASRVALANLIFDVCKEHDVDYQKVKEIAFDRFDILGPHMTQVPGPDGKRGFGGKCLPKDIRALSSVSSSKLLRDIILYNDTLRDDLNKVLKNYNKDGK